MFISHRSWGLSLVIALTLFVARSEAATISWGPARNVVNAFDLATNGKYVDALYTTTGGADVAIFDTVFHGQTLTIPLPSGATFAAHTADISIETNGDAGNNNTASMGGFPAGNYKTILSKIDYGSNNVPTQFGTITFSNLTIGRSYQTQIWSIQPDGIFYVTTYTSGANSVSLNLNPGQFTVGSFTADAISQSLTFQRTGGGANYYAINAIALLDVTAPVPEPGTLTLMALSAVGFVVVARRRRKA